MNVSKSKVAIFEALAQYLPLQLNLFYGNVFGLSPPCYSHKFGDIPH